MSRSSFSKAYKEIANLNPMEMTFTIEDADLDKLHDVLKDINVRECPWFEVQDKHGNKAKYYREPQWIPCSERLPRYNKYVLVYRPKMAMKMIVDCYEGYYGEDADLSEWNEGWTYSKDDAVVAWMPLPEPYGGDKE